MTKKKKEKLIDLLKKEEELQGVKMGYVICCSRSGDIYWGNDFWKNTHKGMIEDLINKEVLKYKRIKNLIKNKYSINYNDCCDSYFAIEVN